MYIFVGTNARNPNLAVGTESMFLTQFFVPLAIDSNIDLGETKLSQIPFVSLSGLPILTVLLWCDSLLNACWMLRSCHEAEPSKSLLLKRLLGNAQLTDGTEVEEDEKKGSQVGTTCPGSETQECEWHNRKRRGTKQLTT